MEFSRGHSESVQKVERGGAAWEFKRQDAASKLMTAKLPGWLTVGKEYVNGRVRYTSKVDFRPGTKEVIERIFDMAIGGEGVSAIAQKLNREGCLSWRKVRKINRDKPAPWNETAVYFILRSPATYGLFQPCGKGRKPSGEPIPGYFPAVITEAKFHAAGRALASRRAKGGGKRGRHINLFAGLLIDARDGGSMTYNHNLRTQRSHPQIMPVGAKQGTGAKWSCFPADIVEQAVLSMLVEVNPSDVLPLSSEGELVAELSQQHETVADLVRKYKARMESDPESFDMFADEAQKAESKRRKIAAKLAEAQREAASPLSEAWGGLKGVAELLERDPSDPMRLKVKTAVRKVVKSIHCLFLGGQQFVSPMRIAILEMSFHGSDARRCYHIDYWPKRIGPGGKGSPESWVVTGSNQGELLNTTGLSDPDFAAVIEKIYSALIDPPEG